MKHYAIILVVALLMAGTTYGGYTFGYRLGSAETKAGVSPSHTRLASLPEFIDQ